MGEIDVVLKKADFLYGIGGAPEGVLMSALAITTNHKMFARLIRYEQIWPNESETATRIKIEKQVLSQKKLVMTQFFRNEI